MPYKLRGDEKICLLRLSALGDLVMWVPVVRALQHKYTNLKISWVIADTFFPLLQGLSGVEFIVVKKKNIFFNWRYYKANLSGKKYDILLLGQASMRAHLLSLFIRAKKRIGFGVLHQKDAHKLFINDKVTAKPEHLMQSFMRFSEFLGADTKKLEWNLPLTEQDKFWASEQLPSNRLWLAISLAASKAERDLPVDKIIACIRIMQSKHNVAVVLLGAPTEHEFNIAKKIIFYCPDCLNLVGKTNLKQLAAILKAADVLLAPDTGLLHLAVAMQTPVVGLHAVVPAKKSGAFGYENLAVDYYYQAAEKFLKKSPQQLKWGERVHHPEAMNFLPVSEIVEKLELAFTGLES